MENKKFFVTSRHAMDEMVRADAYAFLDDMRWILPTDVAAFVREVETAFVDAVASSTDCVTLMLREDDGIPYEEEKELPYLMDSEDDARQRVEQYYDFDNYDFYEVHDYAVAVLEEMQELLRERLEEEEDDED